MIALEKLQEIKSASRTKQPLLFSPAGLDFFTESCENQIRAQTVALTSFFLVFVSLHIMSENQVSLLANAVVKGLFSRGFSSCEFKWHQWVSVVDGLSFNWKIKSLFKNKT